MDKGSRTLTGAATQSPQRYRCILRQEGLTETQNTFIIAANRSYINNIKWESLLGQGAVMTVEVTTIEGTKFM